LITFAGGRVYTAGDRDDDDGGEDVGDLVGVTAEPPFSSGDESWLRGDRRGDARSIAF
tara:strand:- start:116 stop:289 length:174 start_codon:yes stop_codon:yes gene_type:complete